ncbi:MAG: sulfurtransferase [Arcobacter sp.]|nr:sulfurtransferase [Arcobacter sp.]|tara:strand:+ start:1953 stop:2390 length:438 start_codon:yes stop_codon:yes gene_type:complete
MKKILFILIFISTALFANSKIDYRTAKIYKDDISSKMAFSMQQEGALLIDVRTKPEFNHLRSKGSINIPIFYAKNGQRVFNRNFLNEIYQVSNKNINRKIILICRSGSRTKLASNLLAEQGFSNVYNVTQGFQYDWIKEKLPTEK